MKSARFAIILLFGLLLAQVTVVLGTEPMLPDRPATHFNVRGTADSWMSRRAHTAAMLGLGAFLAAVTAGPLSLARHLHESAINLPNRDYWLAPERRASTFARLSKMGLQLACLSVAMTIALQMLVVRANLRTPASLTPFEGIGLVAVYLVGVAAILIPGVLAFRLRPEQFATPSI